jgi:hypothetical protein
MYVLYTLIAAFSHFSNTTYSGIIVAYKYRKRLQTLAEIENLFSRLRSTPLL